MHDDFYTTLSQVLGVLVLSLSADIITATRNSALSAVSPQPPTSPAAPSSPPAE